MSLITTDFTHTYQTKIYSLTSRKHVLIIKEDHKLILRSALILNPKPVLISSLFSLVDLFQSPFSITYQIPLFKASDQECFTVIFILDLDISDSLTGDFNTKLKPSLFIHSQKFDLLEKNIALKAIPFARFTHKELLSFMHGSLAFKKINKFSYAIQSFTERDTILKMIFSNNKIKKIDVRRDSIIPKPQIVLGKSLSNKDIGIDSHVLFLTGKKDFRKAIITSLLRHFIQLEDYHIVLFDFGLNFQLDKSFFRKFSFDDILLDPFSFKDVFSSSQQSLFISHLSFISKTIFRLNDRQVALLEEHLTRYFKDETHYSINSFLSFVRGEMTDNLIANPSFPANASFSSAMNDSDDYTNVIKGVDNNIKSLDLEALVNKLTFLDHLLNHSVRNSLFDIFSKNHLDIFTFSVAPDQKALFFYLFNLFYTLNDLRYKNYKFFFLDIDSILFENFKDIELSWLHSDLRQSLFDASEIYPVKRIFSTLETRIFCSSITNAPYSLVSSSSKDNIDKLQFLHDYSLLESPSLQRQEFFKITLETVDKSFDLLAYEIFSPLVKLLFAHKVEWSFAELFVYFSVSKAICKDFLSTNYLHKNKSIYMVTDKAMQLKQIIIEFLAYQPNLSLDENDFLISLTDSTKFNIFKQKEFTFSVDIELICTRLLANQFLDISKLNPFLLYYFLAYKKSLITTNQLSYYLVVSQQLNFQKYNTLTPEVQVINQVIDHHETDSMMNYFSDIQTVLQDDSPMFTTNSKLNKVGKIAKPQENDYPDGIQGIIDKINSKIKTNLPDSNYSFPDVPIAITMKFLDNETNNLLLDDLSELANEMNSLS